MANTRLNTVLRQVRSLSGARPDADTPDAELLGRFVSRQDEAAFEALLRRHGPMVLRVARGTAAADTEDVFQATFLLLARKAGAIRKRESVASWLHGVAHRLALAARTKDIQRRAREKTAAGVRTQASQPDDSWAELEGVLHEVIEQLPERYRGPLVSCYLEGRTQEEAARQLGVPLGTVRSWLARGRALLRTRLLRRGVTLSAGGVSGALLASACAAAAVPAPLLTATLGAVRPFARGESAAALVSARVSTLLHEGTAALVLARVKIGAACALAATVLALGAGLVAQQKPGAPSQAPPPAAAEKQPKSNEPGTAAPADGHGDPLPPGAVARLGTVRFRHEGWISQFALAPDGRSVAAVAGQGLVLWDAAAGRPLRRFEDERGDELRTLAFAPDGKAVAVGGQDCELRLLDTASGREIRRFVGHRQEPNHYECGVWGVAFTRDGQTLVNWGSDRTVRLWDVRSGKERRRLAGKDRTVLGLSPDAKLLAVLTEGSTDTLRLWDVAADREVRRLVHPLDVRRAVFSADGKTLAVVCGTAEERDRVVLWELPAGREIGTLAGTESAVFALAFAPDGKSLASGEEGRALRLWDVRTRKELRKPLRLAGPVYQLAFSPDGATLLSRGPENQVRLWDVAAWRERPAADGPRGAVGSLAYSPDGKVVAACSGSGVWLWEAATGKAVRRLDPPAGRMFLGVAFSADGRTLAAGDNEGTVHIWDPRTGAERRRLRAGARADHVALSPDGAVVAAWDIEKGDALTLWQAGTGKKLRTLTVSSSQPGVRPTLHSLAFAPDGKTLYAGSGTNLVVQRWDVATGKDLTPFGPHDGGLNGVALARDGRSLAVVSMGGTLYLWEQATGQVRASVRDAGYATAVAVSPDGRLLALANTGTHTLVTATKRIRQGVENRGEVRLVRAADGKVVRRFTGHAGGVSSLRFSPDGRTLASAGQDTTVLIWRIPDGAASDPKAAAAPGPRQSQALWDGLRGDAAEAHRAMLRLIGAPERAVRLLGERLRPVPVVEPGRVAALLKALAGPRFREREQASAELKKLGEAVEPALRKALQEDFPLESRRRLEALLNDLAGPSGERLRTLRAVETLERIGSKDARVVLGRLAEGAAGAWLTEEARATLRRLAHPHGPMP